MKAVAVVAALLALAASTAAADARTACRGDAVRGTIGGRAACLREASPCVQRFERSYRRYDLTCAAGTLEARWSALRRPLFVPRLAAGEPCPVSPADPRTLAELVAWNGHVPAWGAGPAYPVLPELDGGPLVAFELPPPPGFGPEWGVAKTLWFTARSYRGRVLVRGAQLDGPNDVRFEDGRPGFTADKDLHPASELRLADDAGGHPATTRLRAPGCYAYQLDGWRFSRLLVFRAVAHPPSP
jgi:hypothetical protein